MVAGDQAELYLVNSGAWEANEGLFRARAENDARGCLHWFSIAHGFNQDRVRIKNAINAALGSGVRELKEYN